MNAIPTGLKGKCLWILPDLGKDNVDGRGYHCTDQAQAVKKQQERSTLPLTIPSNGISLSMHSPIYAIYGQRVSGWLL